MYNPPIIYGRLNKLLVDRATGISVDVFSAEARNWGMALMVRTGPAEWNIRAMARLKAQGMKGHAYPKPGQGGITTPNGEVECPDEETVFQVLGWPWTPPAQRR